MADTDISSLLIERPDRLLLSTFAELVTRPPAPWQVRGVLREQSVSLLYGKRGCYKSFLALDLGASVATGQPWQGHEILQQGLVIYVAGEGGGGMVQRARAWAEHHQTPPSSINMLFVTEPVVCTATSDDMEILISRLQTAIDWYPEGWVDPETGHQYEHATAREWPRLIIIDTLARCFIGDENQQEDMGMFIQGVDRLKQEFNCSVLILHHTGRDESHERGSTALGGACDTVYRLDNDSEAKQLLLTNEKMKDSREPEPVELYYQQVKVRRRPDDDPLEELTSVVLGTVPGDNPERTEKMLRVLEEAGSLSWGNWRSSTGIPKTAFHGLVRELDQNGVIVRENNKWKLV